jgi:bacteriophage N4 adsorption protein B
MIFDLTSRVAATIDVLIVASAILFAVMGVDDVLLDLAYWVHRWYRWLVARRFQRLTVEQLRTKDQQRIAIFVPCWQEHEVVDKMVELACSSLQYARYDIFVGVYPNDPLTVEKAKAVAQRFPRVQVVVNERDGPTTKAQNLNEMWKAMLQREGAEPYDIMVLHDVEDVIHPISLLLYNYLIPRRDMVQLPVFPLERPWNKFTAWTYADEFAENHLKDLVARETFGSFVPCAGVGCAFNRPALEAKARMTGELFPTASLTEDYQLGLHFRQSGLSTIIVHQRLGFGRAGRKLRTAAAYVATREFFPDTFATAVRQKARWIVGICFQAWQQTGWTGNLFTRYTLYRDRKAILSNIIVLLGYGVFIAATALWLWGRADPDVVEPHVGSEWWPLLAAVLAFSIVRVLQKGYFVGTIYGPRQGLLSVLRIPWGGIINAFATLRACRLFLRSTLTGTPLVWSKTAHAFPTRAALSEYRRQLGEVLIEQELVSSDDVAVALAERREGERIGETLVRLGYLTQRQLTGAVARQIGAEDGSRDDLVASRDALALLTHEEALHHRVLPLRITDRGVIVAIDDEPSAALDDLLKEKLSQSYTWLLVEPARLLPAIERSYAFGDERRKPLGVYLLDKGWITRGQLESALVEQDRTHRGLFELVVDRGFVSPERAREALQEYFGIPWVSVPREARVLSGAVMKLPTRVLRDNVLVPYEADGERFVASPFPLDRGTRELVTEVLPGARLVAAGSDDLGPLRRDVLKIVERRRQLGEMLVDEKLVTTQDIARALEARIEGERLGETLVRLGILTEDVLHGALVRQAEHLRVDAATTNGSTTARRQPIGAYLVEKQYLTRVQLDEFLQRQDGKHLPLFAMAIESRALSPEQAAHVVSEYFETAYETPPAGTRVPLEYLRAIPTKLLRDHDFAVYESNGGAVLAAPYPIADAMRERISAAAGRSLSYALCSSDTIAPIRREMLNALDVYEIESVEMEER